MLCSAVRCFAAQKTLTLSITSYSLSYELLLRLNGQVISVSDTKSFVLLCGAMFCFAVHCYALQYCALLCSTKNSHALYYILLTILCTAAASERTGEQRCLRYSVVCIALRRYVLFCSSLRCFAVLCVASQHNTLSCSLIHLTLYPMRCCCVLTDW
jgi:hypothetical protein